MLKFKEFLKEEPIHISINTDTDLLKSHLDKCNEDLEAITAITFVNSALFVNAVRGTLERYGILLPAESNMQQLSMEGEFVYALGESGLYAYAVHNLDPQGNVEGYAQIVDRADMEELVALDAEEGNLDDPTVNEPSEWMKYPKARRDDDSGNTDEYA
jgi:hypothetical protein